MLLVTLGLGAVVGILATSDRALPRITQNVKQRFGLSGTTEELPGHWGVYEAVGEDPRLSPEQLAEVRRLRSLGYAGGTVPAQESSGVTAHHPESASRALRYYTSGHEPAAYLMNSQGQVLHAWHLTYDQCIQQSGHAAEEFLPDPNGVTSCWRRAFLLPDGAMLAIFEGRALAKIDQDSRVIWSRPWTVHHDLDISPDGTIFVLTREPELVSEINPDHPVLVDYITHLSAEGELLGEIDLVQAFAGSVYSSFLDHMADRGDIFHTNTLEILDGRAAHLSDAFAAGNFLISVRELGVIAVVDPRTEKVVWALGGMWSAQHQPTFMEDGNILLFDNQGHRGRSKVIEIDPLTQEVVWSFADSPVHPLYSKTCGSCQRLPGGHTLITESDNGRALEVTSEGSIVWEFRNPRRTGRDNEFIAAIMEMVMLPEDYYPAWLTETQ